MRLAFSLMLCLALLPLGANAQVEDGLGNANTYVLTEEINDSVVTNPFYNSFAYCSAPGLALSPLGGPFINFGTERDTFSYLNNHEEIGETDIGYTAGQYLQGLNYSGVYAHNEEDFNPGDTVDFYPLSSLSQTSGHSLNIGVDGGNTSLLNVYIDGAEYVTGLPQVSTVAVNMDTFLGSAMDTTVAAGKVNENVEAQEYNIFTNNSYCESMSTLSPNASNYVSWPAPGGSNLVNYKNNPTLQSTAVATYTYPGTPLMQVSVGSVPSVPAIPAIPQVSALAYRRVAAPLSFPDDPAYRLVAMRRRFDMQRRVNNVGAWRGAAVLMATYGQVTKAIGRPVRGDVGLHRNVYFVRRIADPNFRLGLDKFRSGSLLMIFDCESGQLLEAHFSGIHA